MGRTKRPVTDDDVLDWWEAYDAGLSTVQVGELFDRHSDVIGRHLRELGVMRHQQAQLAAEMSRDEEVAGRARDLLWRYERGLLTPQEKGLWDAMAAVPRPDSDVGADNERRSGLRYARSLDHVLPSRGAVVQSARQRRLDRWAGSFRKTIRRDLRNAGLMT